MLLLTQTAFQAWCSESVRFDAVQTALPLGGDINALQEDWNLRTGLRYEGEDLAAVSWWDLREAAKGREVRLRNHRLNTNSMNSVRDLRDHRPAFRICHTPEPVHLHRERACGLVSPKR